MRSSNSGWWCSGMAMTAVVVSCGVVSAAVLVKWSVPLIVEFAMWEVPLFWSMALSWVQPPYLYLLVNCIILSIVASSKLHLHPHPHPHKQQYMDSPAAETQEAAEVVLFGCVDDDENPSAGTVADACEGQEEEETHRVEEEEEEEEFVVSRSTWTPPKREKPEDYSYSKPPVSSRFAHRKAAKPTPEGRKCGAGKTVLRVSRPKRQETLEATWRTITEGRPMPLKRHLRKSDTFSGAGDASPVRVMKKSETFGGGSSSPASGGSSSGGRLRREASPSQDELNRRVEAFIKKFNEEMRLQRQDSLKHFRETVGRGDGAH